MWSAWYSNTPLQVQHWVEIKKERKHTIGNSTERYSSTCLQNTTSSSESRSQKIATETVSTFPFFNFLRACFSEQSDLKCAFLTQKKHMMSAPAVFCAPQPLLPLPVTIIALSSRSFATFESLDWWTSSFRRCTIMLFRVSNLEGVALKLMMTGSYEGGGESHSKCENLVLVANFNSRLFHAKHKALNMTNPCLHWLFNPFLGC